MTVDKMQKMNYMIRELKKHGFANSSIDAFNKVEKIYDPAAAGEGLTMKEQRAVDKQLKKEAEDEATAFFKNFDKFKENTNKKIDKLSADMTGIVSKLNEMIAAIKELEKLKQRVAQQQVQQTQTVQSPAQQDTAQANQSNQNTQQSHPRTGSSTPGQVDLKKHFYFGNK